MKDKNPIVIATLANCKTCTWFLVDNSAPVLYQTECLPDFVAYTYSIEEKKYHYKYCPYCGKEIHIAKEKSNE
jgi:hypothetical protein